MRFRDWPRLTRQSRLACCVPVEQTFRDGGWDISTNREGRGELVPTSPGSFPWWDHINFSQGDCGDCNIVQTLPQARSVVLVLSVDKRNFFWVWDTKQSELTFIFGRKNEACLRTCCLLFGLQIIHNIWGQQPDRFLIITSRDLSENSVWGVRGSSGGEKVSVILVQYLHLINDYFN